MFRVFRWIIAGLIAFAVGGLGGCASHRGFLVLRDIDKPLRGIQKVVSQSFPEGPAKVQRGGRLFISKPMVMEEGILVSASPEARHRFYVKIFIRGGQRPYTLNIEAIEERKSNRDGDRFQVIGRSDKIAQSMTKVIYKRLRQQHEENNIIDNFRPF